MKADKNINVIIIAGIFSLVSAFCMTYAILTLPTILDNILRDYKIGFGQWPHFLYPSVIGFSILLIITIIGFTKDKTTLSLFGSIGYFIPTLAHFTWGMYTFYGIGIIRVLWGPPDVIGYTILGDIVNLPLQIIIGHTLPIRRNHEESIFVDRLILLSDVMMIIGFFILTFSIFNYLYGKYMDREIVNFWFYKYVRHPQYLGYIIWSYGVYARTNITSGVYGESRPKSFPWVVSFLLIICIALIEEINLSSINDSYKKYKDNSHFMMPLPKVISYVIVVPYMLLSKNTEPNNKKDIILVFVIYLSIIAFFSWIFYWGVIRHRLWR